MTSYFYLFTFLCTNLHYLNTGAELQKRLNKLQVKPFLQISQRRKVRNKLQDMKKIFDWQVIFPQSLFNKQFTVTGISLTREFPNKLVHSINDDSSTCKWFLTSKQKTANATNFTAIKSLHSIPPPPKIFAEKLHSNGQCTIATTMSLPIQPRLQSAHAV